MSSGLLGYEPQRVRELERRAGAVVEHLLRVPAPPDPLSAGAGSAAGAVREHVAAGWLPALLRISSSTALIAPIVDRFTAEERAYFQGFVDANATSIAAELSRYDDHAEYAIDHLPDKLRILDSSADWSWLAELYLIEQYHQMIDGGDVTLQRDGDVYWIDPFDLTDTTSLIASDVVLAAVAASGSFRPGTGISEATAKSLRTPMPEPRPIAGTVARPNSAPVEIAGYTHRGAVQAAGRDGGRGVARWALEDAVAQPRAIIEQRNRTFKFTGRYAVVVLNEKGFVITGYATTAAAWAPR
jgi:hypothetical protein